MTNRYYTDTGDPFENDTKQNDLDHIKKNLTDIFEHGDFGDSQTEGLNNVTARDVKNYIKQLKEDNILDIRYLNSTSIEEGEKIDFCDYLSTATCDCCVQEKMEVHFLESNDFAAAVSVIQTGSNGVTVRIDALEDIPEFLKKKWIDIIDEQEKMTDFTYLKNQFGLKK